MANVLVTGGAGFIGSHLVWTLLERGDVVRVLDNFSTGRRENLEYLRDYTRSGRLDVLEGDLRDPARVREAVRDMEVIFHQAAFVSPPKSMADPQTCFEVNVQGTNTLLEAARQAGIRRVLLASSAAVYGEAEIFPLTEDILARPLSPYAASKHSNEIYADLYTRVFGLEVAVLRYFNVYGPRQSLDSEYAAAIPIFLLQFIAGQPVTVYGDGKQTRDLIYVADVVQANLLAAEHPEAAGQVINICTGREASLLDLLAVLKTLFPVSPEPVFDQPRPGDIYRSVGSPQRAAQILGFHAQTSLADGLRQMLEWMRR